MRYIVNKYCGRVYCGNGLFETLRECIDFAQDGFCDRAIIFDTLTGEKTKINF